MRKKDHKNTLNINVVIPGGRSMDNFNFTFAYLSFLYFF